MNENNGKPDREQGLYGKFYVERTDGRSAPGEKHHGCTYFVLDLDHDPHAVAALEAYAASCEEQYPTLAFDLRHTAAATGRKLGVPAVRPEVGPNDHLVERIRQFDAAIQRIAGHVGAVCGGVDTEGDGPGGHTAAEIIRCIDAKIEWAAKNAEARGESNGAGR